MTLDPTQELVAYRCDNPNCGHLMDVKPLVGPFTTCRKCNRATRMERLVVVPLATHQALEARAEKLCEEADTLAHQAAGAVAEPRCFHENVRSHQQELGNAIARTRHALSAFNNQPTGTEEDAE